jgi:CHAT domain-containing protein
MPFRFFAHVMLVTLLIAALNAQPSTANGALARALHFADLYNWADAAPAFAEAEKGFSAVGDKRNTLYAKLGVIRSNIERGDQTLPLVSAQLAGELDNDPLLHNDRRLRMFCLIVKGDIDAETNTAAMRDDWRQVQMLAQELGDSKWQYRALAQLGVAAFYDADLQTASKNVGMALAAAMKAGDVGSQIRFLTMLGTGLVESKMYDQALAYSQNAIKLAAGVPDAGYQFAAAELRTQALIGLKQHEGAEHSAEDLLTHAKEGGRTSHEAIAMDLLAQIAAARNDRQTALQRINESIAVAKSAGLTRVLPDAYAEAAEFYRLNEDLANAERSADLSAAATQASGDLWAVPQHLQQLAELEIARGRFEEADRTYDRAEAFIDALIGKVSTVLEKTAIITASSEIYSQHFSLIAEHLEDPRKAYSIIEQVRGRVAADLLAAGAISIPGAKDTERAIAQLRLKLMTAHSNEDVHRLRDQIFLSEQARWVTPGISILKAKSMDAVGIEQVERSLGNSAVMLEYVLADPHSYCLVISPQGPRIVQLPGKKQIASMISAYLKAVKAKRNAAAESRALYDAVLRPIKEAAESTTLIVVRDGQLNLVPFDGLREPTGKWVVEARTVMYSPSAATFQRVMEERHIQRADSLLAVGGIPYSQSAMNKSGMTRGNDRGNFVDLPSSADEVKIVQAVFPKSREKILVGLSATETAFKAADLANYGVIHMAVHGFADPTFPDRAALVLRSDRSAGDDGFLQASEIVQLHLNADLVVLSSCDTAVGPLQGQEGIADLTRAFLLAGARTVVSTLWEIDDEASLFLMKHFYAHLQENRSGASALTAAKRDMLRTFGSKAVPYDWAAFTIEGAANRPIISRRAGD